MDYIKWPSLYNEQVIVVSRFKLRCIRLQRYQNIVLRCLLIPQKRIYLVNETFEELSTKWSD